MIGQTLRHYRIERQLAVGGMGEVYLAQDLRLERLVAVKVLPAEISRNQEARESLLREARSASRLNHPNILTVYAEEEIDGQDLIILEFFEGRTLAQIAAAGALEPPRALEIAIQITDGLNAAHRAGLIHRDIKPANIMVNAGGRVKIMDFGIAAVADQLPRGLMTFTGTMAYASPEQIQCLNVDFRTDIWSMGVVMYEMLAGRRPFHEEHAAALLYAIVHEDPPPLTTLRPDVPRELQRIVERCLAKTPAERFQSAEGLAEALRDAQRLLRRGDDGLRRTGEPVRPAIAVVPFANLSAEREQDYLCEGIAEEIINALAQVGGLRVTGRNPAFAVYQLTGDIREVGRRLNVDTLLQGSVRKIGDQLRITAQLIDVADGFTLWSERFERDLKDVFAVQDEIAHSVVRSLAVVLNEDEGRALARARTSNVRAYDFYLRGLQFFHRRSRKALQFARQMFTRSVEIDADYALAHAALAGCIAMLVHFYGESRDVNAAEADRASLRALELDPALPAAHTARGLTLWIANRYEESDRELDAAMQMDPRDFDVRYFYGRACFQRGDLEKAAGLFQQACDVREDHEAAYFLAQNLTALGRHAEAERTYWRSARSTEKHFELNPDDARACTMAAVSLCRVGQKPAGLEWAQRALAIDPEDAGIRYNVACLFALEGEKDKALECLEYAVRAGFAHKDWVDHDPDLDSLRDDPRFQALHWRQ